jgi:hypothetical protein
VFIGQDHPPEIMAELWFVVRRGKQPLRLLLDLGGAQARNKESRRKKNQEAGHLVLGPQAATKKKAAFDGSGF